MRLFVGIPLAAVVLAELSAVVARLRTGNDGLRWMAAESWHITLQFLGSADPEKYDCVVARLGEVHSRPVPVRLEDLGFFDRAGVFFAGVDLTPELVALAQRVIDATTLCGFEADRRPFHPHITLARAKDLERGKPLRALEARIQRQPAFSRFVATEFLLYESHLSPAGSAYEVRHRFSLDSGARPAL